MIEPFTKFSDVPLRGFGHKLIEDMSEEQCRYALWAMCTVVLGVGGKLSHEVNRCIQDHIGKSHDDSMNEAVAMLASLALGRIDPDGVRRAEQSVMERRVQ